MSDRPQDPELRARFAELKRQQARQAPAFADVLARAQTELREPVALPKRAPVFRWRRVALAGGFAAAAVIAALIVFPNGNSQKQHAFEQAVQAFNSNPALGGWRSPTDALLNVPGNQLMSSIPAIGASSRNQ